MDRTALEGPSYGLVVNRLQSSREAAATGDAVHEDIVKPGAAFTPEFRATAPRGHPPNPGRGDDATRVALPSPARPGEGLGVRAADG